MLNTNSFAIMLKGFNQIAENSLSDKTKKDAIELKEAATHNAELNGRQKEAIVARCNSYINGTYGNTKTAEQLGNGKAKS